MGTDAALLPTQALSRGLGGDVDRVQCLLFPLTSCLPGHPAAQSLKTPRLLLATVLILPGFYVSLFPPQDPQPPSAPSNYLASKTQNQFFTANLPGDPWVAELQAPFLSSILQVVETETQGALEAAESSQQVRAEA